MHYWDIDRLGRFDALEAECWVRPMREAGVELAAIAHTLDDFGGRIIPGVQAEAKHAFVRDLARKVVRSQLTKAARGERPSGTYLLGSRVNESCLFVPGDPVDAALVRRLFDQYDAGRSLRGIAVSLNRQSVLPPRKRQAKPDAHGSATWRAPTVRSILGNRASIGTFVYNWRQTGTYSRIRGGDVARVARDGPERSTGQTKSQGRDITGH